MAHFAELDENNIVTRVLVGDNNDPNLDEGYQWLIDNLGGTWVKTSYNTYSGKRRDQLTNQLTNEAGFRKNYAGVGFTYDSVRDAFIPPAMYPSWILDEDTCLWKAPVDIPLEENKRFIWDESIVNWKELVVG